MELSRWPPSLRGGSNPSFAKITAKTVNPHTSQTLANGWPRWQTARQSRMSFMSPKGLQASDFVTNDSNSIGIVIILQHKRYGHCNPLCDCERNRAISTGQTLHEAENRLTPKFDGNGLLSAVVQHAGTGEVLMVAFMDQAALDATLTTGEAHFHSRSRGRLWKKGETSGHVLQVEQILVDCDQDALVLRVLPAGPACHTGAPSCFYRRVEGGALVPIGEGAR